MVAMTDSIFLTENSETRVALHRTSDFGEALSSLDSYNYPGEEVLDG